MSLQDGIFAEVVENDITLFSKDARRKRVLVFPPVNNYRRFLIHQLVQDQFADTLKTFSIGQGLARRTVVCYQSDVIRDYKLNGVPSRTCDESANSSRLDAVRAAMGVEERRSPSESPEYSRMRQVKSTPAVQIYRPPAARRARNEPAPSAPTAIAESSSSSAKANRQRRPDRAVYVPKHRRSTDVDDAPHNQEEIVSSSRPRFSRPGIISPCDNDPSRDQLSPNDLDRNLQSSGESWNKENSSFSSSSSSSSSSLSFSTDSCNKNYEDFAKVSGDVSQAGDELHQMEIHTGDNVGSEFYSSVEQTMEIVESPAETKQLSMDDGRRCLSERSDDFVDSVTRQSEICIVDKPFDLIGEGLASDDARTNFDENAIRESTSSSSMKSAANSRKNRIELRESPDCDDRVNIKNLETLRRPHAVSNVLIISDTKQRRAEEKSVKIEKEDEKQVVTSPPEKKPKKVARAKSKPASPPSPPIKLNRDECDWDSLFDDNGECLDPTLIEELTAAVGEVTIQQPKNDYKAFSRPVEVSSDEFGHVIEVYNFPSDFKTSDLAAVFSPWKNGGFELKWVDDTHCLGVFSSPLVAAEVLSSDHPFVKTRPLSAATALSKTKARKSAEFLQPYKSRPETCAALARRLVTGALGVKLATARQEREQEKVLLREAKEKRRLANKQREDVWEGIIAEK